jgi:hypothetical protein
MADQGSFVKDREVTPIDALSTGNSEMQGERLDPNGSLITLLIPGAMRKLVKQFM